MIKKNQNNEAFLDAYKKYENAVINVLKISVFDFETQQTGEHGEQLKLCRNIRNYLSHNADGYKLLNVTPQMTELLNLITANILKLQCTVSEVLNKRKAIAPEDTIFAAAVQIKKHILVPVVDNKGKYLFTANEESIVHALVKSKGNASSKFTEYLSADDRTTFFDVAETNEPLKEHDAGHYVVGVKNGIYKGVVDWSKLNV